MTWPRTWHRIIRLRKATQALRLHLVFVPVPGGLVFCVCVLLIVACVVWLGMLLHKGVEHDKET